ncbi:hypothetical protein D6783_04575 [Candidatus Woesearchaeota archaeon]|nr:MAG: hypothetical protein D6783_04575 [Candidatus Woesearchaeota archaeon]
MVLEYTTRTDPLEEADSRGVLIVSGIEALGNRLENLVGPYAHFYRLSSPLGSHHYDVLLGQGQSPLSAKHQDASLLSKEWYSVPVCFYNPAPSAPPDSRSKTPVSLASTARRAALQMFRRQQGHSDTPGRPGSPQRFLTIAYDPFGILEEDVALPLVVDVYDLFKAKFPLHRKASVEALAGLGSEGRSVLEEIALAYQALRS